MNHLKHLILLACFATATAQIPVLTPPGSCGTQNPVGATAIESLIQGRVQQPQLGLQPVVPAVHGSI